MTRYPWRRSKNLSLALLGGILIAGAFFIWWTVARADREMRAVLLQQARLVGQRLSIEDVQALSGTEADLANSVYLRLKEHFTANHLSNPQYSCLYLMGRKADGAVFFFLDSEPTRSKDSAWASL